MSAIPYMPLYIADYLADAAHLTTTEHGAYMLLIMNYWQRGKPLDNSNGRLANVARMSNEEWAKIAPTLAEFFDIEGDQWSHKRIEQELQHFRSKSDKAKAAGKASAQRRSNGRSTDVQRTVNHTDTDTDTDTDKDKVVCESAREPLSITDTEIRHRGFVISLPAIELATIRTGLPRAEIKTRCHAHALQWAAEIDAGKLPRDVVPQKIANFLAASIMGEANRDSRTIHRTNAKCPSAAADAPRKRSVMDVIRENPLPEVIQ